jgi:hypothetical protein
MMTMMTTMTTMLTLMRPPSSAIRRLKRVAVAVAVAFALPACGSSKPPGTVATAGTPAERALCVNIAKTTWQASTPNLLDAVVNDPDAGAAMVRDSRALQAAIPGVPQTDAEVRQDLAKLAIDCQSPVGSS